MTLFARATWRLDARHSVGGVGILLSTFVRGVHTKNTDLVNGKDNSFLEKYRARIEEVQGPLEEKKRSHERKKAPEAKESAPRHTQHFNPAARSLSSVMHVDLIEDKTPEEIAKIWTEYHKTKDGVCAVIPASTYTQLHAKASLCPLFLFPLPRDEGYEFIYSQFAGHRFYFTSLIQYKLYHENAPICLTLTHYTELQNSKGLVLMAGEIGSGSISLMDAQCLANEVQLYYASADPDRYALLRQFNHEPQNFDYTKLVEQLQKSAVQI